MTCKQYIDVFTLITNTMKLVISDLQKAEIFVKCFQHMKTFVDSINIVFKMDQMYVQCMDSAMVLIMEFSLPKVWFDSYSLMTLLCHKYFGY